MIYQLPHLAANPHCCVSEAACDNKRCWCSGYRYTHLLCEHTALREEKQYMMIMDKPHTNVWIVKTRSCLDLKEHDDISVSIGPLILMTAGKPVLLWLLCARDTCPYGCVD